MTQKELDAQYEKLMDMILDNELTLMRDAYRIEAFAAEIRLNKLVYLCKKGVYPQ